jgi:hypothetical protein
VSFRAMVPPGGAGRRDTMRALCGSPHAPSSETAHLSHFRHARPGSKRPFTMPAGGSARLPVNRK